jgi:hypothetical protein
MADRAGVNADERDELAHGSGDPNQGKDLGGPGDDITETLLLALFVPGEGGICAHGSLHDAHPVVKRLQTADLDAESETVEQLRAQVSLFGVHRTDEHQPRRMRERHSLTFHDVDTHGRRVEEHVDEVVVEEVDLVDVEQVAVGGGQKARFEATLSSLDRRLHIDASHDPVLAGVDGELHHPHGP